ncbi:MAG: FAD-dependent oxidoreductase [Lachnospiraceae bacterium]
MKYIVLGAGPAGLVVANRLKQLGKDSVIVLECGREAGGLCRSSVVDNAPFDIGGGHFLDADNIKAVNFLFKYMPAEEWDLYERDSRILINGYFINSPVEANIWQMGLDEQIEYLKSIAIAGCNLGHKMPNRFIDWIDWKLGKKIASEYMLPYNKKMFADELNELGTYWLDKLPNVSFEETLRSCLTHRACGKQPGHARFYYPKKYGFGEVWIRMADSIRSCIYYGTRAQSIDFIEKKVKTTDGEIYSADIIISTIPWREFKELKGMPNNLITSILKLKHSSIETRYFAENMDTQAQWIYYPDQRLPYHRILVRHNFCPHSKGYWTETRKERTPMFSSNSGETFTYVNEYAYPLNTIEKPAVMKNLLGWCEKHQVYGLGRWGEHQHYNSDVVVNLASSLAERL